MRYCLKEDSPELHFTDGNSRTNEWLKQIGLQLPSRTPNVGSVGSISYDENGVNISGKTWKELFGEDAEKNNAEKKFSLKDEEAVTDRELLANTLASLSRNPAEERRLAQYK